MNGWSLAMPAYWPALLLLPIAGLLGFWRLSWHRRHRREVLGPRVERLLGQPAFVRTRALVTVLALLLLALALLQPIGGDGEAEPAAPEIAICLDVSWSMAAQDVAPSRFARAVAEIRTLTARAGRAQVALVVFAGEALLRVPLTADLDAVAAVAAALAPGAELRGGTDLGAAIDTAVASLQRAGSIAGSVILLTDGEDFGQKGAAAAQLARQQDIVVHCVGYGTRAGSKIAVEGDGGETFLRDATGEAVISALDAEALTALANAGGGHYTAGGEGEVLLPLFDTALAPRAQQAARRDPTREVAQHFQWPLLAAFLLWMLRLVLPERRR